MPWTDDDDKFFSSLKPAQSVTAKLPRAKKATPEQEADQPVFPTTPYLDHLGNLIGGALTHPVTDATGFFGDIAAELARHVNQKINPSGKFSGEEKMDTKIHPPGSGPATMKSNELHDWFLGKDEEPQSRGEKYAYTAVRGAADTALGGPAGLAAGAAGGVGSEVAAEAFPDSEWAPIIGGIVGGAAGGVAGGAGVAGYKGRQTGRLIKQGSSYPDYQAMNDVIVNHLEGGGTLEHPNVSKKGAVGPQQVMMDTASDPGFGIKPWNGKTQSDLARVGRQYSAALLGKYEGDVTKALAAYNAGPGKVDGLVKKYGDDWWKHVPGETKEYLAKGLNAMDRRQADRRTARPMAPEDIAQAMEDPEAAGLSRDYDNGPARHIEIEDDVKAADIDEADMNEQGYVKSVVDGRWLPRDEAYEEAHQQWVDKNFEEGTKVHGYGQNIDEHGNYKPQDYNVEQFPENRSPEADIRNRPEPTEVRGNITDLTNVRQNLDNQKTRNLLDDKLESAINHEDAVLHDESPMTLEEATRNRETAEKMHEMLGEDHPYKEKTQRLVDTWRSTESILAQKHDPVAEKPFIPLSKDTTAFYRAAAARLDKNPPEPKTPANDATAEKKTFLDHLKDLYHDESGSLKGYRDGEEPTHEAPKGSGEEEPPIIGKLREILEKAAPLAKTQERAAHVERKARSGKVSAAMRTTSGEAGYYAQLKALKGELPKQKIENDLTGFGQEDLDALFKAVQEHPRLSLYGKVDAQGALVKLLKGEVPTPRELKVLSEVLAPDIIDKMKGGKGFGEHVANVLNIPRSIMASTDLSAPFRQGIFLVGRKEFYQNLAPMLKAAFSEDAYQHINNEIQARPSYSLMEQAGLSFAEFKKGLSNREEQFMSDLAEKIPVVGKVVRGSGRAYMGFLNKLRADVFDSLVRDAKEAGINFRENPQTLKNIGRFVNLATGRGDLGRLNNAAPILSATFFSPRLMASRLTLLNPSYYLRPERIGGLDPFTRKQALKSLFSFTAIAMTTLTLAKLGGADVEVDPRSSDFAKIKKGNTRVDISGGFQPYLRLTAQMMSGEQKNPATGEVKDLTEGKFGQPTRLTVAGRFARTKFSPIAAFVADFLDGKDVTGKPFSLSAEAKNMVTPLMIQDVTDAYKEWGLLPAAALAPAAILGFGVQTYRPRPKTKKSDNEKAFGSHEDDFKSEHKDLEKWFKG